MSPANLDRGQLEVLADMTVRLTELRLRNCGHLCIENVAPEIFGKLLYEFRTAGEQRITNVVHMEPVNVDEILNNHV